jgi:hypothetical protein
MRSVHRLKYIDSFVTIVNAKLTGIEIKKKKKE